MWSAKSQSETSPIFFMRSSGVTLRFFSSFFAAPARFVSASDKGFTVRIVFLARGFAGAPVPSGASPASGFCSKGGASKRSGESSRAVMAGCSVVGAAGGSNRDQRGSTAIASASKRAFFGSAFTTTQLRAG